MRMTMMISFNDKTQKLSTYGIMDVVVFIFEF